MRHIMMYEVLGGEVGWIRYEVWLLKGICAWK